MTSWNDLTALERAACIFSDAHKDAYGFRPRFDTSDWTVERYEDEIAKCAAVIEDNEEDERKLCLSKQREFEEDLDDMFTIGAADRATAIRWWFEANGAEREWFNNPRYNTQDIEHVAYCAGVPIPLWRFILPEVIPGYAG